MYKETLTIALGTALLSAITMSSFAAAELLDRKQTRAVFNGSTGTHWYLDHNKHYRFNWKSDGELTVNALDAKPDDEPVDKGKWYIKQVEKKKGMSDEEVAAANAALQSVYCHKLENMWSGHEICWEAHQVSFDIDADNKPLPKQEFKLYREAGAETGAYVITSR